MGRAFIIGRRLRLASLAAHANRAEAWEAEGFTSIEEVLRVLGPRRNVRMGAGRYGEGEERADRRTTTPDCQPEVSQALSPWVVTGSDEEESVLQVVRLWDRIQEVAHDAQVVSSVLGPTHNVGLELIPFVCVLRPAARRCPVHVVVWVGAEKEGDTSELPLEIKDISGGLD